MLLLGEKGAGGVGAGAGVKGRADSGAFVDP
jgi:hypothetical protein